MQAPTLYIIAGPNGAGKTTASMAVFPSVLDCHQFVNADEIAKGLSPLAPESVAVQAGRIMLWRIDELLSRNETFAIETTLATRSYVGLVNKAHKLGYKACLIYIWLSTPKQALARVAERVAEGGHGIPDDVIVRRYFAGIRNLFNLYMPIVDEWLIADNSYGRLKLLGTQRTIYDKHNFTLMKELSYGKQ